MKTLIKFTLILSLFGSVALADGDMPGGNYQCPPEGCTPPPCTADCSGGMMAQRSDDGTETFAESFYVGTDLAVDFVNDTLGLL